MNRGKYTFTISGSNPLQFRLKLFNTDGTPYDLSSYSGVLRFHANPNLPPNSTFTNSLNSDGSGINMTPVESTLVLPKSSGSIEVFVSYASSSNWPLDDMYYYLNIHSGSTTWPILEGTVKQI